MDPPDSGPSSLDHCRLGPTPSEIAISKCFFVISSDASAILKMDDGLTAVVRMGRRFGEDDEVVDIDLLIVDTIAESEKRPVVECVDGVFDDDLADQEAVFERHRRVRRVLDI